MKLQLDVQEKDRTLKDKTALILKMEEKVKSLEKKHKEELDSLKQELVNY